MKSDLNKFWNIILSPKTNELDHIVTFLILFEEVDNKLTDLSRAFEPSRKLEKVFEICKCILRMMTWASKII